MYHAAGLPALGTERTCTLRSPCVTLEFMPNPAPRHDLIRRRGPISSSAGHVRNAQHRASLVASRMLIGTFACKRQGASTSCNLPSSRRGEKPDASFCSTHRTSRICRHPCRVRVRLGCAYGAYAWMLLKIKLCSQSMAQRPLEHARRSSVYSKTKAKRCSEHPGRAHCNCNRANQPQVRPTKPLMKR